MRRQTPDLRRADELLGPEAAGPASVDPTAMIAMCESMVTDERKARLREVIACRLRSVVVVLDGPHDPHNGAAVIRTCDAFGIQHLHVIERYEPFLVAPAVAKGSEQWVDVHTHPSTHELLSALAREAALPLSRSAPAQDRLPQDRPAQDRSAQDRSAQERPAQERPAHAPVPHSSSSDMPPCHAPPFEFVATSADGELLPSDLRDIPRLALVVGNEREGIAPDLRRHCRRAVRVPMMGFIDSLNLSVSTAILLHAATFGRAGDLPLEERARLYARGLYLTVPRAAEVLLAARRQP